MIGATALRNGKSILLPGDIEQAAQEQLLAEGTLLQSDVLVLPHHGAWVPTLPEFIESVDPKIVLISSGRRLSPPYSAGPKAAAFFRKLATTRRIYHTGRNGWIHVTFGRKIAVTTMH